MSKRDQNGERPYTLAYTHVDTGRRLRDSAKTLEGAIARAENRSKKNPRERIECRLFSDVLFSINPKHLENRVSTDGLSGSAQRE